MFFRFLRKPNLTKIRHFKNCQYVTIKYSFYFASDVTSRALKFWCVIHMFVNINWFIDLTREKYASIIFQIKNIFFWDLQKLRQMGKTLKDELIGQIAYWMIQELSHLKKVFLHLVLIADGTVSHWHEFWQFIIMISNLWATWRLRESVKFPLCTCKINNFWNILILCDRWPFSKNRFKWPRCGIL